MTTKIDAYASQQNYRAHLSAIFDALPAARQGAWLDEPKTDRPLLVAAQTDLAAAYQMGNRRVVLTEHGAGQSYGGARAHIAQHPSYAGGHSRFAALFLHPNEQAAARDRAVYPKAQIEVVGSPRVGILQQREAHVEKDTIAVSFHWRLPLMPELEWAFSEYRDVLRQFAQSHRVLGHAHPRIFANMRGWYERVGIEPVESFDEIVDRAALYVCDNSSTIFEFAALDRPVVLLNARSYRRNVEHGLRFWHDANVGLQVDQPRDFADTIERALRSDDAQREQRRAIIADVYPYTSADRAVEVVSDWLSALDRRASRNDGATRSARRTSSDTSTRKRRSSVRRTVTAAREN